MANQRIDQLNAETTPAAADVLPVFSIASSDTKKITVKNLVQQGAALVDNASIPNAKVNLSGISGTNLSAGTVAVSKLDTSTIPATGGVTVSSSNLQLVAPTSPIVRNAGTGSLEHAVSGATAGTYTKVTVDTRGHVTVGAAVVAADLPIAVSGTVGVMSPGTGLSVTGGGVLNHTSSITAGTTSGFTFNAQGHITGTVALAGADLPIATSSVRGGVRPGTGLTVDGNGILDVTAATNAVLGGVIAGSDFSVSTGTISLATQAGIAAGQYTKLTVNSKGVATAGTVLSAGDIPNIATSQITSGTLAIDRYGANTITGAKLANYATGKISEAFPTADYISQLFFNPLDRTLYMWDGNVYQPIGVSYGQVVFSGTYDAGTNLITSVTTEGAAIGLTVGGALTSPVTANKSHYVVVDQPGTGTAPAPTVALSPPDMLLSNGTTWILLDVSDTVTAQLASNVQVSPAGNIASNNVQSALQELDTEKLALAGGTLTGNLALNTGIAIVYEGATTDAFETTLYVVDPTADRTILLPNVSGTVITTGDTGTVTSTMLLDGTILNADINASAAIVDTKLDTIATALKVSNSATTATNSNTASAIVARDASGNFTAGTITAALTGAASSNVLKAGDTMTGALVVPLASASTPSLTFTGDLNTGIFSPSADAIAASTGGTERLRIDSSGRLLVGTSTAPSFTSGVKLVPNGTSEFLTSGPPDNPPLRVGSINDAALDLILFHGGSETAGGAVVMTSATSVAYNTSSDYRLKENVTSTIGGIIRLQQLKPKRFNFIGDPNRIFDGFLAHEVQEIVPESITGKKDAVDKDGVPKYQGIDQSKLVPLLTAALQEAIAKIETLEARLTAAGIA
jgi:Chaperone of endosialidase